MKDIQLDGMLREVAEGRTDLVFDLLKSGYSASQKGQNGLALIHHCAYCGDVSAMKFLLIHGESLQTLGDNLGLNGACFHGHWRLCKFLIEQGADVNKYDDESPLHAALSTSDRIQYDPVIKVLLVHGADPNSRTKPGVETGAFMRDSRTKGETPLHRAAAFGEAETIQLLLDAGATIDARDAYGDTPLAWASWYLRSDSILRQLCYGEFTIRPGRKSMRANLIGDPLR